MTSAARRASLASSMVQQPRAPERYDAGLRDSARWMPVTSCPASAARAAATAESTPPDMAATTSHHRLRRLADRARSTTGPIASTRASTSAAVEVWPEREAQRVAGLLVGAPHGQQHVRGLRDAGGAGGAGRALDAASVEQHQQRVAVAAREAQVGVAGQALGARAIELGTVEVGLGHGLDDPADQVVAQRRHPGGVLGLLLHRELDRGGQARDRRGVQGAAADVALLAAAVHEGAHLDLAAHDQGADAVGAADLVPGEGQRVDAARGEVDRDRARRPARRRCARGCRGRAAISTTSSIGWSVPTSLLAHITDTSATVDGSRSIDVAQRVDVEPATVVDGQQLDLGDVALGQPHQRVEDGVVLDGGAQDAGPARVAGPARPEDALEREVVGLGAARGEHDVAGPAAQGLRDRLARLLHDAARVPPGGVQRAGVADVGQVGRHGLDGRREHRGGRGVVEVDGRLVHRIPQRTACHATHRPPGLSRPGRAASIQACPG